MQKLKCLAVMSLTATVVCAGTYYVAPDGNDYENTGVAWSCPLKTIQKAVALASSGDVVIVSNGVYLLDSPVEVPAGKYLKIRSYSGNFNDVIVDGQHKTHCFAFLTIGENLLSGITVRRGTGGAYVADNATVYPGGIMMRGGTISNCRVTDCHSEVNSDTPVGILGGGIFHENGHVSNCVVDNCTITNITTATSVKNVYGGGICAFAVLRDTVVSNCEIYVEYPNYTGSSVVGCSGGGVLFESTGVMTNCIVANCRAVSGTASDVGIGGGVAMFGGNSTRTKIVDTLVYGCMASRSGGGIHLRANGGIEGCTISNNTVFVMKRLYSGNNSGGGIHLDDHIVGRKTVRNSVICCNTITNDVMQHGDLSGGGGLGIQASTVSAPAIIENCIIRDNIGFNGGALLLSNGKGIVVSNCWASGNYSLRREGFAYASVSPGALIADCRIDGHYARWVNGTAQDGQVFTRHCEGNGTDNEIIFRNCFVVSNNLEKCSSGAVWIYKGIRPGYSPVVFEQCTFAGNLGNACVFRLDSTLCVSNFFVRGCALYGNGNNKLLSTDVSDVEDVMTYTYSDERTNMPTDEDSGNLTDVTDPRFKNASAGDYRLKRFSPLINAGGAAAEWMGTGHRNGPYDMGDGTFTVSGVPGMSYGVSLSRNEPRPRLRNSLPDIGCFEYWTLSGMYMNIQ